MKLNEFCKSRRLELKLTQRHLAKIIGIRHATLCDFENGKYGISSKTLDLILEELGISLS